MYCIKTLWSDDSVTLSDPMTEWYANWMLHLYGDALMWHGQARPVRAILIPVSTPNQLIFEWRE
jgi:hypothetical protein